MSKLCRGATGVVACLHQQGVEHTLGLGHRRIPAKTGQKNGRQKGDRPLLPHQQKKKKKRKKKSNNNKKTKKKKKKKKGGRPPYPNANRSSTRNQRKKNHPV